MRRRKGIFVDQVPCQARRHVDSCEAGRSVHIVGNLYAGLPEVPPTPVHAQLWKISA